jgi:hypothetical protein
MLFFVVIIIDFSYLRKIIKIYNGATEGLVQQLSVAIVGFSGITVSQSYFRSAENTLVTKLATSQSVGTSGCEKTSFF